MDEKKYKLTRTELIFLIENVENEAVRKKINNLFSNHVYNGSKSIYNVTLTEQQADLIIDELMNLFTSKGIDAHDEPNEFGLQVESVLDAFSSRYS
ncbi:MAG: hypothetical protein SNF33_00210 (plasmid) [Candidatus Algichlamydia australiensis]|nr:hypothetical protein [Chlamydiales bacterium]